MKNTRGHHSAHATGDPSSFPREVSDRSSPRLVSYARSPPGDERLGPGQ
jgi:hypothetical protein